MIDDTVAQLTREEKEALLIKLQEQIEKTAAVCVRNANDKEFSRGKDDLISALVEDAWIRINNPKLDKNRSPEGYVMNGVRLKAQQLAAQFHDDKQRRRFVQNGSVTQVSFVDGYDGVDEVDEVVVDYMNHPECIKLRELGDREEAIVYCIQEKNIRNPDTIKIMFERCGLDFKGMHPVITRNLGEKRVWKGGLYGIVRELYDSGIIDIADVRAELDRRNILYRSRTVLHYLKSFVREKKCQK